MERAVSGRCADFSGIVEAGSGGGGEAPTGGLDKPTTAPRIESANLYPQGIRLSCRLWARQRHDRGICLGAQHF